MSSMLGRRTPYPEGLDEQWRKVLSASGRLRRTLGPGEDPPVLFMPVWGADTAVTTRALETVLAHSVRLRGVRVVTAYCHGALPACLIDPLGNHFPPIPDRFALTGLTAATCRYCSSSLERLYGSGPLELVALTSYVQPKDLVDARTIAQSVPADRRCDFVYEDVHVGEHAMASTLRATGRGTLLRDELHEWLLTRQLMGSIAVVRATERLLAEVTPRRVVITHGIYVDHGTIAETARKRGVPVVVFVRPYRRNTVLLCHGDTYHRALLSEPSALWEDRVLSDGERSQLADYVESKRRGALDNVTYHPRPIEGIEAVRRELQLDSARPLVSLFTNVMWDAQIYHATSAFASMLEWLFETIEHFTRRPEVQLVIRVHPAEVKAKKKSEQRVTAEVERVYPRLPSNIRVVGPESDVSSYDLAEASSAALVFGTKMGLEVALRGIPVVVAGESFVRGKGFTHDAATREEYADLLSRVLELPRLDATELERARRYGFHFYFRRQIDFPFVEEGAGKGSVRLTFSHLDALLPGRDAGLDVICQGLLTGTEFVAP